MIKRKRAAPLIGRATLFDERRAVYIGAVRCRPAAQEQSRAARAQAKVAFSLFPSDNERRAIAVSPRSVGASRRSVVRARCAVWPPVSCSRERRAVLRQQVIANPIVSSNSFAVDYLKGWYERDTRWRSTGTADNSSE